MVQSFRSSEAGARGDGRRLWDCGGNRRSWGGVRSRWVRAGKSCDAHSSPEPSALSIVRFPGSAQAFECWRDVDVSPLARLLLKVHCRAVWRGWCEGVFGVGFAMFSCVWVCQGCGPVWIKGINNAS